MSQQIRFFEKSKCDFSDTAVALTASQGNTYVSRIIDRSNMTAWLTTGSVDADNTTIEVNFGDVKTIDSILLLKHNFKSYKIEYWNGSAWVAFATAIDETTFTAATSFHQFTAVDTLKVLLTIRGTQTANGEKRLYQFVATQQLGQFASWPQIKRASYSRNRVRAKMLSGKESIREQIGAFTASLSVAYLRSDADNLLIEALYASNHGFLTWLCGGSETQFSSVRIGYRLEDLFLMKCANELVNDFYQAVYLNGTTPKIDLVEVVD